MTEEQKPNMENLDPEEAQDMLRSQLEQQAQKDKQKFEEMYKNPTPVNEANVIVALLEQWVVPMKPVQIESAVNLIAQTLADMNDEPLGDDELEGSSPGSGPGDELEFPEQ